MISINTDRLTKRARTPLLFAVVAVAAAILGNMQLEEMLTAARQETSRAESDLRDSRRQMKQLERGSERFTRNYPVYRDLTLGGLIGAPDGQLAETVLRDAARFAQVNQAAYDVRSGQDIVLETLSETRLLLHTTPIRLRVESLLDSDVFNYVSAVQRGLPGLVAVRAFDIERMSRSTAPVVNDILEAVDRQPRSVFRAEIIIDWMQLETVADPEEERNES